MLRSENSNLSHEIRCWKKKYYDYCNLSEQEAKLIEECKEIIIEVLGKDNEVVFAFDKIKIAKRPWNLQFKHKSETYILLATVKEKDRKNEAMVLISSQAFKHYSSYDEKTQQMMLCWLILEEYYHALELSNYRFK